MVEISKYNNGNDVPLGFYFSVTFGVGPTGESLTLKPGSNEIRFQEVSGLTAELGIETYDEGGENRFSHRLPARAKYNNLILKRGMMKDASVLRTWFDNAVINFDFKPINVSVNLLNDDGKVLSSWEFHGVWPVKWIVSDLKAMENAIVIETAELAYQYFEKKPKAG